MDEVRKLTAFLRATVEDLVFPYAVCAQSVITIISIICIERVRERPTNISFFLLSDGNIASPHSVKQPEIMQKFFHNQDIFAKFNG